MVVLQKFMSPVGVSLSAFALSLAVSSTASAQDSPDTEENAVDGYAVEFADDAEGSPSLDYEDENVFAIDDKALRKSIIGTEKEIVKEIPATAPSEFRAWMNEVFNALKHKNLGSAGRSLAKKQNLPKNAVTELLRSFARVQAREFDFFGDENPDVQNRARLVADINKALSEADHHPLLVQFAASTIYNANFCDESLIALADKGANRATSLRSIAAVTECSALLIEAAKADPSHQVADLANISPILQNQPALTLWLLRPETEQHVAPESGDAFRWAFTRKAIEEAFALGADARGLALYDALDASGRQAMLAETQDEFTAIIDDIPVTFAKIDDASLTSSLAAAMHLAGRTEEARRLINGSPKVEEQRKLVDCIYRARREKNLTPLMRDCGEFEDVRFQDAKLDSLIVSWALNNPETDPYPILEAGFSSHAHDYDSAPIVLLFCAIFDAKIAGSVCADAKRSIAYNIAPDRYEDEDETRARTALAELGLPDWDNISAILEKERTSGLAVFNGGETVKGYADRPPLEPVYPNFARHALAPELISQRSEEPDEDYEDDYPGWPKSWTQLPAGFQPVRWENNETRGVAISQSGLLDRGGEVGRGGYWIHFSADDGKTWQEPLYTGLAAHFPYVIESQSKLPLLKGDHLQIEVIDAPLDTSSISYPPVGLRTLRKQHNLWLDIPINELTKDSNGDGVTDLVAEHLRIDGPAEEAPMVLGSPAATCQSDSAAPEPVLIRKLLAMLTGLKDDAILEQIDRAPDAPPLSGITRGSTGDEWPLFIKGKASDLNCMSPLPLPVFVYGPEGEKALQQRSPDFRLIELPTLVMNRDKTRGYVVWTAGWRGGTQLFWLEDGKWKFESISEWVT